MSKCPTSGSLCVCHIINLHSFWTDSWHMVAPIEQIELHICRLWKARRTDPQILQEVLKHIDTNQYVLGMFSWPLFIGQPSILLYQSGSRDSEKFVEAWAYLDPVSRAILQKLSMMLWSSCGKSTQMQEHVRWSVFSFMKEVWLCHGKPSIFWFRLHSNLMPNHRRIIFDYFTQYKPNLICLHKAQHLRHRRFWAASIWTVDQHDKWLQFGLALQTGIEPFSGKILWIHVWHSNCNPQLILIYYLNVVKQCGCEYFLIEIHSQVLMSFHRHSISNAKWPWHRKLWHCQCTDYDVPLAW